MAWKPTPFKLICNSCGWSNTYAPKSDIRLSPLAEQCPKCRNKDLKQEEIEGAISKTFAELFGTKF